MGVVFKSLLAVLALLLALACAAYFAAKATKADLTEEARSAAPGQFAALSDGQIHHEWRGPEGGPVIVMVHGFSTPSFIFAPNAEALAAEGFRVLTFDHFGRGWSDRPEGPYTTDFCDRELLELTERLGITQPFGLVGLSMGGVIATEFAARHPERVSRVALLVPAGLELAAEAGDINDRILRTPLVGEWVWTLFGEQILLAERQQAGDAQTAHAPLAGDVTAQMQFKGYLEALLSSYRNLPMRDRDEDFRRLAATGLPVLAIFGGSDTIVSPGSAARFAAAVPDSRLEMIPEGEHGLNYQLSHIVNPMLLDFFQSMR